MIPLPTRPHLHQPSTCAANDAVRVAWVLRAQCAEVRGDRRMSVVSTGLLLARQHAQRAVLFTIPALQYKVSSSRRILSPLRLYSTHPPHPHPDNAPPAPPQPSREKPKRPPKDLQVARQVVDGVESSKDSVLKAYCLAKVRKNSSKKNNIKEATLDTISFSEYDPDNIFILLHLVFFSLDNNSCNIFYISFPPFPFVLSLSALLLLLSLTQITSRKQSI